MAAEIQALRLAITRLQATARDMHLSAIHLANTAGGAITSVLVEELGRKLS